VVYVTHLYQDVLGRTPEPAGLQGWVAALDSGALTPMQVSSLIWASPEHDGLEVDQAYQTLLHRGETPQERAGWIGLMQKHAMSDRNLALLFVTSPEYTASHPSTQAFVIGLYNDLLGRNGNISPSEVATRQTLLDEGVYSRASAAWAFLTSEEAVANEISSLYASLLHRQEGPGELSLWLAAMNTGQVSWNAIPPLFLSSPEYLMNCGVPVSTAG
jgi:hypothetical protein